MPAKPILNDETILTALISCGSVKAAAEKLNVSPPTIQKRLQNDEFVRKLSLLRDDALKAAGARLSNNLTAAVDTLSEIMQDDGTAAQTRANAASQILNYGLRYAEITDIVSRLEALERGQSDESKHSGTP